MKTKSTILTREERDILILVALHGQHLNNAEIARRLGISVSRVKTLIHQACTKLGARRRADAIVLALKQREITIGEIFSLNELIQSLAPLGAESIEKMAQLLSQRLGQETTPSCFASAQAVSYTNDLGTPN